MLYRISNHPQFKNNEAHDINCKSLSRLINSVCPSCLNNNIPVLEFLRMLPLTFKFVAKSHIIFENKITKILLFLNFDI